jgi:hypothetical protein
MSRKLMSIVGVAALVGVLGGALVANAGSSITAPETLSFKGTVIKDRFVDVGKPGFGPGDQFLFVEELTDDGEPIGKARIECTFHIGEWSICTGTFNIAGRGEIVGQGMVRQTEDNDPFDVPITGGTGDFANVRGVDHIEPLPDDEEMHTLELLP